MKIHLTYQLNLIKSYNYQQIHVVYLSRVALNFKNSSTFFWLLCIYDKVFKEEDDSLPEPRSLKSIRPGHEFGNEGSL